MGLVEGSTFVEVGGINGVVCVKRSYYGEVEITEFHRGGKTTTHTCHVDVLAGACSV